MKRPLHTNFRALLAAGLSLTLGAVQSPALANGAPAAESGWYLGASLGASRNRIDHDRITTGLLAGGITTGGGMTATSIADDNRSTGYKLYGGYRLNRWAALEVSGFDLGRFGFEAQTAQGGALTGRLRTRGIAVDLLGTVPLTGSLSAFGRAGIALTRARADFGTSGAVVPLRTDWRKTSPGPKFGLGLDYALTRSLSVRVEDEVYRINDSAGARENINLLSVSLVWRFGER